MITIPFEKTSYKNLITLLLIYYVILLLTNWSVLKNPITYLIILVLLLRFAYFVIRKKTKGIAITILDQKIICNNSILNLNLEILKSSIESIDVDKKVMTVNNLENNLRTRLLFYLNKNKILLTNISIQNLILLRENIFPETAVEEKNINA